MSAAEKDIQSMHMPCPYCGSPIPDSKLCCVNIGECLASGYAIIPLLGELIAICDTQALNISDNGP